MLNLPPKIKVKDLLATNVEYRPAMLRKLSALYSGGPAFRELINEFLVRRAHECGTDYPITGGNNSAHYEERKARSPYVPRIAGLIDFFVSSVFPSDPTITAEGGEGADYWTALNSNFDGLGRTFGTVCRDSLRETLKFKRAYLQPIFPAKEARPGDVKSYDCFFRPVEAAVVDDWQFADDGELRWVRTHTNAPMRDEKKPYLQPAEVKHFWTFYDSDSVVCYSATRKATAKNFPADAEAAQETETHEFGFLPFFDFRCNDNQWVLGRCAEIIVELFNRESDLSSLISKMAWALIVLSLSDTKIQDLTLPDLGAFRIRPGEGINFISPDANLTDPQFKDVERLKDSLAEVVQTLALNAVSSNVQRPVAAKTELDMAPLKCLLRSFAWPIREGVTRAVLATKRYRGEGEKLDDGKVKLKIDWPEAKDVTMAEARDAAAIKTKPDESQTPEDTAPGLDENGEPLPTDNDKAIHTTQDTVLNGAQVTAATAIVLEVAEGKLPRDAGLGQLRMFFNLTEAQAAAVMGSAGAGFKPKEENDGEGKADLQATNAKRTATGNLASGKTGKPTD